MLGQWLFAVSRRSSSPIYLLKYIHTHTYITPNPESHIPEGGLLRGLRPDERSVAERLQVALAEEARFGV